MLMIGARLGGGRRFILRGARRLRFEQVRERETSPADVGGQSRYCAELFAIEWAL